MLKAVSQIERVAEVVVDSLTPVSPTGAPHVGPSPP
jgi:hypothetical protein